MIEQMHVSYKGRPFSETCSLEGGEVFVANNAVERIIMMPILVRRDDAMRTYGT